MIEKSSFIHEMCIEFTKLDTPSYEYHYIIKFTEFSS